MNTPILKPCPACGSYCVCLHNLHVECTACGHKGPVGNTNEAAALAWNNLEERPE